MSATEPPRSANSAPAGDSEAREPEGPPRGRTGESEARASFGTPRAWGDRTSIAKARRLVVKVGSSLVTNEGRGVDHDAVARWAHEIAALTRSGKSVVLVSSGAIAEGMQRLGWTTR
ncbi:MAG TPA: hypothetical protein VGL96_12615, partial [Casimicrobiaceae bacterium]